MKFAIFNVDNDIFINEICHEMPRMIGLMAGGGGLEFSYYFFQSSSKS
jgi:hypothetical protein